MKKYPFVKQTGIKDCGVACLKMIIKYYGGDYPISKLRELTNTTKEGTSAYNLIEGAKKIGLDACGYEVKLKDISNDVLPAIAYTVIDGVYQHYMVIYKISKKGIIVGDPSTKLKKMKYISFSSIFQNVIITFSPLNNILKYEETTFLKDKIKYLFHKNKKQFLLLFILTLSITLISIILTLPIKFVVELISTQSSYYIYFFVFILFCIFIKFILEQIKNNILLKSSFQINKQLCITILDKILFLPYKYYRNHTTGEILSKIQDFEKVSSFLTYTFSNTIIDVLMIISISIFMFYVNSSLFYLILLITIILSIISYLFQNKKMDNIKQYIYNKSMFHSYLVEAVTGFETVKGLNIENEILNKSINKYNNFLDIDKKLTKLQLFENNVQNLIYYIGNILVLLIGCYYTKSGNLSLSDIILFYSLYSLFLQPVLNIISWIHELKEIKYSISNIEDLIIDEQQQEKIYKDKLQINYQNLQVEIKNNEKIMLLGESGIGKSTLLKMIKGYLDNNFIYPNIKLNDIIYISQNEILFTDTIYNNLIIGNSNEKELSKVIKLCCLESVIKKRKLGLQSLIEENGYNLSGGEKQRIILARALLKNPKILLIDEGLSQLNNKLERIILKNIIDYYNNMTIIFVSHRNENSDLFHQTYTLERNEVNEKFMVLNDC